MSNFIKKYITARSCATASFIVMALVGGYVFIHGSHSVVETAEIRPRSKAEVLGMTHTHRPKGMTEKIRGSLAVKIKTTSEFEVNQPLVYTAEILPDMDLQNVQYRWILPPEIELVQGQLKGQLSDLRAGKILPVEITVNSVLDENSQIHFQVKSELAGAQFSATAQYNTVNQPVLNEKIKELHEKTKKASKKEALR